MLHRHFLATLLAASLVCGCSSGTPPATNTTAVNTAATTTVSTTETPSVASTETPGATPSGTPDVSATGTGTPEAGSTETPGTDETLDAAYIKLKEEGVNLALGKGYAEAVPALQKALEVKPDDPEVHFYLMLSMGTLEDTPGPKSPAYTHAKKVLDLAPGSPMADRARDYVLSAESEPVKPLPDLNADPIDWAFAKPQPWKVKPNLVFTLPEAVDILPDKKFGDDLQKELWYLQVNPRSVSDKVQLPKGTQFTIKEGYDYNYGKTSWRGKQQPEEYDTNMFALTVFNIEVDSGPKKGTRGWYVNQLDRFLGVDEKEKAVWGTKMGPRLNIVRTN